MRKRYSEKDIKFIKSQAELGVNVGTIADTLGVSTTAIHHVLSRNKIKFCRNPILIPIPNEIWINCLGIPDIQISNMGRFLRVSTQSLITGYKTSGNYITVDFSGVGVFSAHRLVAQAFLPNPENKPEVNHKNGIKSDNRVNNLEWSTPVENMQHAISTGLKTFKSGYDHHRTALTEEQVQTCFEMRASGMTYLEIGAVMGVANKTVSKHLNKS